MRVKTGYGWPHDVTKKDLKISYFRGSGAGGQHRNKRDTACRIVHTPTKVTAECQEHKSQHQNLKTAFNRLADKLVPIMKVEVQKLLSLQEEIKVCKERVRTYNESRGVVKDYNKNKEYNYRGVLEEKELNKIIG